MGGHVTQADEYDIYADTVNTPNVRLFWILAILNTYSILGGDVCTAYLNALTKEKLFIIAGIEFGEEVGKIKVMRKALYGAKGSANVWFLTLASHMAEIS